MDLAAPSLSTVRIPRHRGHGFHGVVAAHFDAALQAHDMIVFVRKALEELPPAEMTLLAAANETIIAPAQRDFGEEWERFYEDRRGV